MSDIDEPDPAGGASTAAHRFLSRLRDWWARQSELDAMDSDEINRIASDLGITAPELRDLVARGPDAQAELSAVEGIGPVVAEALVDFFHEPHNREQLAEAAGGGKNGCKKLQTATKEKPLQVHVTVNEVIEASPEGAIGKNYLTYPGIMGIRGDDSHSGYVGGYQDVYVKTDKGWRIKKRIHIMPPDVPGSFKFPDEPPATK